MELFDRPAASPRKSPLKMAKPSNKLAPLTNASYEAPKTLKMIEAEMQVTHIGLLISDQTHQCLVRFMRLVSVGLVRSKEHDNHCTYCFCIFEMAHVPNYATAAPLEVC